MREGLISKQSEIKRVFYQRSIPSYTRVGFFNEGRGPFELLCRFDIGVQLLTVQLWHSDTKREFEERSEEHTSELQSR